MVGRTLGHYAIIEPLGAGGMGEVYRAHDTTLKRDVALKVLPEEIASDPERRERFEREAKSLAVLDHPNIVVIHSVEKADGVHFITMQLVEGKTLSELIPRNGFPLEKFFDLAIPLADAISAAHEQGIVHRDLKPSNIMVSNDGRVRVLDFGLAKLREEVAVLEGKSELPTVGEVELPTEEGRILGTAAYMSPEQAEGREIDHRTDIFSLGIIFYELATGERPFKGDTKVSVMSSVVKDEPTPITELSQNLPRHLGRIIKRALAKDPERRFQSAKDLRNDMEELSKESTSEDIGAGVVVPGASRPLWWRGLLWGVGIAVGVIVATLSVWNVMYPTGGQPEQLIRLAVELPPAGMTESGASSIPMVAISPDGMHLAYVGRAGSSTQLFLRSMDQLEAELIPGTLGASAPFFSPDGEWIGFNSVGKLRKVSVAGGPPADICEMPQSRGATWSPDGTIFFTPTHAAGLWRVSASGGEPESVTTLDSEKGEHSHRWPHVLPDGRGVLFTIWAGGSFDSADIAVLSLETGRWRTLIENGSYARYSPTGHVIYAHQGLIMAALFDLDRLELMGSGSPSPVLEGVMVDRRAGTAQFSLSDNGTLVYLPGSRVVEGELVWVGRSGEAEPLATSAAAYDGPRLSPDGLSVAVTIRGSDDDVWIHEISRGTLTRFTYDPGLDETPVWSPDGSRLAFASDTRGQRPSVYWRPGDGSSPKELLMAREQHRHLDSWSPDGQFLTYTEYGGETGEDIWLLPVDGDREPRPFLQTRYNESDAAFSPGGSWLAYVSDESGRDEVYVRTFPESGVKWQISIEGGLSPQWAKDGYQLFYRTGEKLMAVDVEMAPTFDHGRPEVLFEGQYQYINVLRTNYDITADGRFLMVRPAEEIGPTQVNVVLNWFEELRRLVPTAQ